MVRNLPLLAIIPVERMLVHEHFDVQRIPNLLDDLRNSGKLRNPPIITPLHDRTGRYLVLDGAHRVLAFKSLGLPHILAQIVEPDDPGLSVHPWNHVVWGLDAEEFIQLIHEIPDLKLIPCEEEKAFQELAAKPVLGVIRLPDEGTNVAYPKAADLGTRLRLLNAMVDAYKNRAKLDRTSLHDMEKLAKLYPHLSGLVMFPRFRIEDIFFLVGNGHLLPSGSTRFTISPRALRVNYPIEELASDKSLEEKDAYLYQWLQERLSNKNVRYYAEPTYLFDE